MVLVFSFVFGYLSFCLCASCTYAHNYVLIFVNMQAKKLTIVNFNSRFTDLVDSSQMTQRNLAVALGISEGSIVNYKRDRIPKADELLRVSQYFAVSIEWLLTGYNNEPHINSSLLQENARLKSRLKIISSALRGVMHALDEEQ